MSELIRVEREAGLLTLRLDRQDKKNALEAAGIPAGKTPGQAAEIMRDVLAKANID